VVLAKAHALLAQSAWETANSKSTKQNASTAELAKVLALQALSQKLNLKLYEWKTPDQTVRDFYFTKFS
jgi:hypothetical protein